MADSGYRMLHVHSWHVHVMRRFIRHPANIPIEINSHQRAVSDSPLVSNVGLGGLSFLSDQTFVPGDLVDLRIPFVDPPFEAAGRIAWCRQSGIHFELGVEFLEQDDAFLARMVEQVCQIENYQREVYRAEGRVLTSEEAALEWISKFAWRFPGASREP